MMRMLGVWALAAPCAIFGLGSREVFGADRIVTLTLQRPSFVSFQNEATQPIPAGGTIRLSIGARGSDGSIPFTIQPADVQIPPVPVGRGARGKYELVAPTSGVIRRGAN